MAVDLELELQNESKASVIPHPQALRLWVTTALEEQADKAEICIRIVDEDESRQLNSEYRQKDWPTNVLSFPADLPDGVDDPYLGDLVICAPVLEREAKAQHKDLMAHWAHIVIHGSLHLLGFDHETDTEADEMEGLEVVLMEKLGYESPYGDCNVA